MGGADRRLHPDFGPNDGGGQPYGIPYSVVPGSTQKVAVSFDYADESDTGPYPFGPATPVEDGSDTHALVVDQDACRLFELYAASWNGGQPTAGSGAVWDLRSDALRPPSGGRFEKGSDGKPTGAVVGGQNAIIALFDKLPKPSLEDEVEGTKLFFRELNRLGITGFVDPGGNNLFPADYPALLKVWRDGLMTVRVAYALNGQTAGKEFEEYQDLTRLLPMGFGDDMLKFNGIGERITWDMNNNAKPSAAQKERFYEIIKWAAGQRMSLTMHWTSEASVNELLNLFEKLNKEVPITGLRVVDLIITEMAVLRVTSQGLVHEEIAPDVTIDEVQKATESKLIVSKPVRMHE